VWSIEVYLIRFFTWLFTSHSKNLMSQRSIVEIMSILRYHNINISSEELKRSRVNNG